MFGPFQYDGGPYKKEDILIQTRHTQREAHVKTQAISPNPGERSQKKLSLLTP